MIRELTHDPLFLAGRSEQATEKDAETAQDLLDTLTAHRDTCVGMAANMIGVRRRIIAFLDESGRTPVYTVMYNPEILKKAEPYDIEEGCLSLEGGPAAAHAGAASGCSSRRPGCRPASETSAALRPRSFSTRSTTATGC